MKRFLLVTAIALATASTAHAGPVLLASSAGAGAGSARADGPASLLETLISMVSFGFEVKSTAPAKPANDSRSAPYQCDETDKADAEDSASAKSKRPSTGPEPVYLAF